MTLQTALTAFAVSFISAIVAGWILLGLLRRLKVSQFAYEDAPRTHQSKSGTPTMGGVLFLLAAAVSCVVFADSRLRLLAALVVACGAVGLTDDLMATLSRTNRGLRARTKFAATAVFAVIFLYIAGSVGVQPRTIFHTTGLTLGLPYVLWFVLGILTITGTIHAVNLTDGLDGLASGVTIFPIAALFVIAVRFAGPHQQWPLLLPIVAGALLAFLLFNYHPAKMFMGDTGSLALGALLSGVAILSGEMLLLILIGGVFVAEALSVIIQVAYFKRTHRRILRMSPLHHHYELGGLRETQVTARFWLASALCSIAGLAIVR